MKRGWPKWAEILITALLTGVVTIVTGLITLRLQEREPRLVYSTADTLPFAGQNQVIGIYQLSISNEGKKEVEDVDCHVRVPDAAIGQKSISASPSINISDSVNGDTLKLHVAGLNPSETIQLSILATAQIYLPPRPEISLRGKGIPGTEKSIKENEKPALLALVPAFAGLVAGSLALMFIAKRRVNTSQEDDDSERHREDQRRVLAYLCGLHGLTHDVDRYLSGVPKTKYWAEADRLALLAINSQDSTLIDKTKLVFSDVLQYAAITKLSQGLVLYNLARIALAAGDIEEAQECLRQAQLKAPKLIATRLRIDPLFKSSTPSVDYSKRIPGEAKTH
ncbi:MAG TPA: tetratricopeptide repeat protein [Blastocatellia bacterium]|nr:tetratricopeptide repeat protein [Blastocatellia bacterium]